jgi:N-acetyl-alpha-D-muramate 1-phosphate uridylyltransferase
MRPDAIMIFAAGLGTRMGELTRHRPKPLLEAAGKPLIAHALDLARDAGIARIVVNTHAHPEQMRAWLAAHAPDATLSHEPVLLETGGGLAHAAPRLAPGPVFTLNADMVWRGESPLETLAAAWDPSAMDALLCLIPRDAAIGHAGPGDFFLGADGRLTRRAPAPRADFVYCGAQIIDLAALEGIPAGPFSLNLVWDRLLARGRLFGTVHPGGWVDVGRPEGLALAEAESAL